MNRRGFTLLEIMVSMTLFTMVGFAVVLLMRTGIDLWLAGNESSQQEDRIEMSVPRLEQDLRHVMVPVPHDRIPFDPNNPDPEFEPEPLPPDNRFLSGYVTYKFREKEVACRYVSFVRGIEGLSEIEAYVRRAGTSSTAEAYIDGVNDEEEFAKNTHLPTGGQCEVLWIWLPDEFGAPPGEERPGVGAVYRAYRSPIGGPGTLLDPKNFDEIKELRDDIQPDAMFQDVILFDIYFWTQYTTHWRWTKGEPRVRGRPKSVDEISAGLPECGPSLTWDSTRGMFDEKAVFFLGRGKRSFNFSDDDIWPRMVRIEFALAETVTELSQPLSASGSTFSVVSGDFATGMGELYMVPMKIGEEWLRIEGRDDTQRDMFRIESHGQRFTSSAEHPAGTPVYFGRIFEISVSIPAFRDDNN